MKFRLALLLCLLPALAWGQQYFQQSGNVTAGHAPVVIYNGILGDGGPATAGNFSEFGLVKDGGLPFCIATALASPRQLFCFGVSDSAAFINLQGYGEATANLNIIINGVTYTIGGPNWLSAIMDQQFGSTPGDMLCRGGSYWSALSPGASGQYLQTNGTGSCPTWATPGSSFNNPIRSISTGDTDTASSTDGTIAWNSATTSAKTESIYACASGVSGRVLIIKDEKGTAEAYPIMITPASGTIDNGSSIVLGANYQAVTLQCDGTSSGTNWMVL